MPRKQAVSNLQMSFLDELDRQLEASEGELIKLKIRAQDIGAELVAILSQGLYINPLDAIREYIQNAVDAGAKNVTIKVTGNSVAIFDTGAGMDLADLVRARQFGISPKPIGQFVGFRGIGIYSAFDLCRRLRITSTRAGDTHQHVMIFDFADMKKVLEADKQKSPNEDRTALIDLLSAYTWIKREKSDVPVDSHFTQVELQDVSDTHIKQLSNRAAIRSYLLRNLPIDFADDFEYRDIINSHLDQHVQGFQAVKIRLQHPGLEDEVVAKDAITGLRPPEFGYIRTSTDHPLAYYWYCRNQEREYIGKDKPADWQSNYQGFVYKLKGFTIGDRRKLAFKSRTQFYRWFTGEIYVIDPKVTPNAARDDFEANLAREQLEISVANMLRDLEAEVAKAQLREVAEEKVPRYKEEVENISSLVEANTHEGDFMTYSRLEDILRDLKRQQLSLSKDDKTRKTDAEKTIQLAQRLQKQLQRDVDTATPQKVRKKRGNTKEQAPERVSRQLTEPLPRVAPKTLVGVLNDLGWDIDGSTAQLLNIIQISLEDVVTLNSPTYRALIDNVEARLIALQTEVSA